ncbi:replication endonuclease [Agaribacterium sp. ZY112]|uniref:replication endonuclease n=1 Tax=Agaribacterium sp. ZY112 TaxID=3233574 RepID=UPI00352347B6
MVAYATKAGQFVDFDGRLHLNTTLEQFGTNECSPFRKRIIERCGMLANAVRAEYLHLAKSKSHASANLRLLELEAYLTVSDLWLLTSLSELIAFADDKAEFCQSISKKYDIEIECYDELCSIADSYQIDPPFVEKGATYKSCINRLCCSRWWRRKLKNLQNERIEILARDLRQVNAKSSPYCSPITLATRTSQRQASRSYLENTIVVNEKNDEFTLAQLSDKSVSNPAIRRFELLARCKGFELIAKAYKHNAAFITLTTPSRFHKMTKIIRNGRMIKVIPNKKYENLSPRDAQKYLSNVWARIQAKLSRLSIKPYGFRIAEPHHDGTPHWHFMLFATKENLEQVEEIFRHYALQDSPDENGAKKRRLKVEEIKSGTNPTTGKEYSATGYLIKYVCKNIDGHGVNNCNESDSKDWSGRNATDIAMSIEAWARTHRIRQFQQIGGASVTVWRELRRLSEQEGELEKLRIAARSNDWAAFTEAMGGPIVSRTDQSIRPAYGASENLDKETGELKKKLFTKYGDTASERVIGLLVGGMTVISRIHYWEVKDTPNLKSAQQKIMSGIVEVIDEIKFQNSPFINSIDQSDPRKRVALDSYQ